VVRLGGWSPADPAFGGAMDRVFPHGGLHGDGRSSLARLADVNTRDGELGTLAGPALVPGGPIHF
jgi:hypothetical protein